MSNFICPNCKKETFKHAKGLCTTCYKKLVWKPELSKCKRCGRELPMHAKGLCGGCYNSVYHVDAVREANIRKWHNIAPELYNQLTKKCTLCDIDILVELHHLDKNKANNSEKNLIGLCPLHHKMIHHRKYQDSVVLALKEKGYNISPFFKPDSMFKEELKPLSKN